jgi:hypothetical protein
VNKYRPYFVGHRFTICGKPPQNCHSEERSDEESLFFLAFSAERFLAPLGMTTGKSFFGNQFGRAVTGRKINAGLTTGLSSLDL